MNAPGNFLKRKSVKKSLPRWQLMRIAKKGDLYQQQKAKTYVLTEEQILQAVLGQKDLMIDAYAQAGIEVSDMQMVEITFLGQTRHAIHTTAAIQGVAYYTLQVFDNHLGQYSVVTTFGSYVQDNTESMLELFYPLN